MMNSAPDSLNPYATSYVPLSKRVEDQATTDNFVKLPPKDLKSSEVQISEAPFSSNATVASPSASWYLPARADEKFQRNLEYLQMVFPGLSYESLAAVYLGNREDMEATIEMLNQLESCTDEPLENLSETSNIGGTTESDGSADLKQKTVKEEPVVSPSSFGELHR